MGKTITNQLLEDLGQIIILDVEKMSSGLLCALVSQAAMRWQLGSSLLRPLQLSSQLCPATNSLLIQASSQIHTVVSPTSCFLTGGPTTTSVLVPVRGMKYRENPQRRCKYCYVVYENGRKWIFCDKFGRHKQGTLVTAKSLKNARIMTHATQGGGRSAGTGRSNSMKMWTQQGYNGLCIISNRKFILFVSYQAIGRGVIIQQKFTHS